MSTSGVSTEILFEHVRLLDGTNPTTYTGNEKLDKHINSYHPPHHHTKQSYIRRGFIGGMVIFITFLTAGVVFGYAALKPVLIDTGAYSHLCKPSEKQCTAQSLRLDLMFTTAAFSINAVALPIGLFLDQFGPRSTSSIGTVFLIIGLFLMAYANDHFDVYIPGYVCLAVGGVCMFMAHINLINLFPSHMGTMNGFITGAFDASSVILMLLKLIYFNWNVSIRIIWLVYLSAPIINLFFALFFLNENQLQTSTENVSDEKKDDNIPLNFPNIYSLQDFPIMKQLRSTEYCLLVLFVCLFMLRLNFYIATVNKQLEDLCPPQYLEMLTNMFNIILPFGGLVTIPIVGYILDHHGTIVMFSFLSSGQIVFGILGLIPVWWIQIITFCVFVVIRTCLYSAISDFCGRMYGFKTFGTIYGLVMMCSAFVTTLQYPLDNLVTNHSNGSFFRVNIWLTGVSLVCFLFPMYLWGEKRARFGNVLYLSIK